MNRPKSYMGEADEHHIVCGNCNSARSGIVYAKALEERKKFMQEMSGNFNYQIKNIIIVECDTCPVIHKNEFGTQ